MNNPDDNERSRNRAAPSSEYPEWMNDPAAGEEEPPAWLSDFPPAEVPPSQTQPPPVPSRKLAFPPIRDHEENGAAISPIDSQNWTGQENHASQGQHHAGSPAPNSVVNSQALPHSPYQQATSQQSSSHQNQYYTRPGGAGSNQVPSKPKSTDSYVIPVAIVCFFPVMSLLLGLISYFTVGSGPSATDGNNGSATVVVGAPGSSDQNEGQNYIDNKQFAKALQWADKEIAVNPNNANLYYIRATSYHGLKKFNLALADATKSIDLAAQPNADYFYKRSEILSDLKQFRKGLKDINEFLKLKPSDANGYIYRSWYFSCMHSPKSALNDANKAVALMPNDAATHELKASTLYAMNSFKSAIASYTTALGLNAQSPSNDYSMRALCYIGLKDNKRAFADVKKALELDPNNAQARDVLANLPYSYLNQINLQTPNYTPPLQSHTAQGGAASPVADKWALLVGVSRFEDRSSLPSLPSPAKDARDLCHYLTTEGNFAPDHVRMLVDEHATLKRVKQELNKFLAHVARPDDLVVIYFSTHGSSSASDVRGDNYICLHDTQCDDLFSSALEMQSLINVVKNRIIARRILLVLDCCFSGNTRAKAVGKTGNFDAQQIAQGTGQVVICSSAPNQVSWESSRYSNGIFTHQLIAGLRSQGQMTTINQAFKYTRENVANEVHEDVGVWQTPVMNGAWKGPEMRLAAPPAAPRAIPQSVAFSLEPDDSSN